MNRFIKYNLRAVILKVLLITPLVSCDVEPKKQEIVYPNVSERHIYEVVDIALKLAKVRRRNLDLHPSSITEYWNFDDFIASEPKINPGQKPINGVLTESDELFIKHQIANSHSFVWDNFRLRFQQDEKFESLCDITVPVFSVDFSYALIAIEKRREHLSSYVIFLLRRVGNKWQLVESKRNPYHAHLGKFGRRECKRWKVNANDKPLQ